MADNSSIPVAFGNETFANYDVSGVKYPRVKLTWGPTSGAPNDADVASGKPIPMQIRDSGGTSLTDSTGIKITICTDVEPRSLRVQPSGNAGRLGQSSPRSRRPDFH